MKQIFLIGLFWLIFLNLPAQVVNLEKESFDKDRNKKEFKGTFNVGYNRFQMQTRLWSLSCNANLILFTPKHFYALTGSMNFIRFEKYNAVSDGFAQFRVNFNHKKHFVIEPFTHTQYDGNRGLQLRWQIGQGVKYHFLKDKVFNLSLGTALMFEYEKWGRMGQDAMIRYELYDAKSSAYINTMFKIKENVEANFFIIHQAPIEDYNFRSRFLGDFSLLFKISKYFSYNTRLALTYDYIPERLRTEAGIHNFIYIWTQGITVQF